MYIFFQVFCIIAPPLAKAPPVLPASLLDQLKPGGRMFAIVGDAPVMSARMISKNSSSAIHQDEMFETCAAPLDNAQQPVRFQF